MSYETKLPKPRAITEKSCKNFLEKTGNQKDMAYKLRVERRLIRNPLSRPTSLIGPHVNAYHDTSTHR